MGDRVNISLLKERRLPGLVPGYKHYAATRLKKFQVEKNYFTSESFLLSQRSP